MASDPLTLERLQRALQIRKVEYYEKRMFGGVCFMVDDKMCFGTYKSGIMFRVDPELTAQLVAREGVDQMEQGGHSMKGFLLVEPHAYDRDEDMDFWIDLCLAYNPQANVAKKKKAKI